LPHTRSVQLVLALLLLMCDAQSSLADMVPLPLYNFLAGDLDPMFWAVMVVNFGLTTIIEFFVVYFLLGRPRKARTELFFYLLFLNLITNPPAQLGVWLWGTWFWIELVVIWIEFGLMLWIFDRMFRGGKLDHPIGTGRTALIVVVANLASFVLGVIGFLIAISLPGGIQKDLFSMNFAFVTCAAQCCGSPALTCVGVHDLSQLLYCS